MLNFNSPSDQFSTYVLDELTANLLDSGKLKIIDRKEINLIRSELDFQMSGEVDDDSIQELGRLLGAQSIVSGSLTKIADSYRIVFRVLNVQSAEVTAQYRTDIANDKRVQALLAGGKSESNTKNTEVKTNVSSSGQTTAQAAAQPSPASVSVPAAPVSYKVGDKGPAGGLIFFDKGNNSGGWRYLEAAPADFPQKMNGVRESINMTELQERAVGKGKSNTQAIMIEAVNKGGGFGWAAQACYALNVNGFSDWFLPSRDELHWMYGNLHLRGLGDFKNERYWSSTSYYSSGSLFWCENFSDGKQDYGGGKVINTVSGQ